MDTTDEEDLAADNRGTMDPVAAWVALPPVTSSVHVSAAVGHRLEVRVLVIVLQAMKPLPSP